ncbi:efflux RND transporter periplasmic adaptor subunit [Arenibacter sp. F20364]|uniref:efflux RND transporter periplasmic adaptor subunit n=1 Tax=Arenibacter sp. F20364 TaxID=2926415 RepID=UPI001FF564C5|nr:efflux RND transporter periplasmic adaptor subunit [Arenibacter sp. F20364]MCK0190369.1 efflux RND transporter periplasmic adaptor subunit [Arenibacter sp. F20364]
MRNFIWSACLFLLISCGGSQEKIFPTKIHLTESVYASVTVQPDSLYQAYAPVAGILDRNLLDEGDLVRKGTPMIQIVNSTPKLNTENARLALQLAQANYNGSSAVLRSLEDEIQSATLSFKNDSMNYLRQKRLWDQNIGSKVEFENRKLAYQISGNNLKQLKKKYVQTKNELSTQVQQALNNYNTSKLTTQDFTVSSKIEGKLYALYKNPGEIVNTMEPLASVGSDSDFIIELLIDEVDIVKLNLGQKALITLDAYGDEVFSAKVSKIYPKKDERSQTFKAEAIFNNPPKALYPGLAGEANILISEKDSVLTIPKEYLLEGNKVNTPEGLVEVVPGLQNLDRVEILNGINETTEILKPAE